VLALFVVAMAVILGIVGLALDGAHAMLNKTRLQNAVDAAALSAAKTLDATKGDEVLADAAARSMFSQNASDAGNDEMAASYASGDINIAVAFSATLHPFVPGIAPSHYVRVTATNFSLPAWFIRVFGFNEKNVGASAVAGPSPTIQTACNLAPMMVCGDPTAAPEDHFGYKIGQADVLKTASGGSSEVGPGNFQLIRLGDSTGGADIRTNMAGSFTGCVSSGTTVPTEPGNTVGPVVQGLNTRFGEYSGPVSSSQYPPDVVTQEPNPPLTYDSDTDTIYSGSSPLLGTDSDPDYFDYNDYDARVAAEDYDNTPPTGVIGRRTLAVTIGDCSTTTNGQGDVPVLGFLCYHLIQKAVQKGTESYVFGQFRDDGCQITGRPGPTPSTGPGPYIIQLYKDETQEAS
jgi:Flp pilus assembly protein TadG